jgi:hypothetical protein
MTATIDRRTFLTGTVAAGTVAAGTALSGTAGLASGLWLRPAWADAPDPRSPYEGPNVVLVRFGGGVRRRETIDPQQTYAPYFLRELCPRGTLFSNMTISGTLLRDGEEHEIETGHQHGTLNLLTGRYDRYQDVDNRPLRQAFVPKVPTLFEYLRRACDVPPHQTLIVNSEDRTQEEFYSFSNHHLFGVDYRCHILSLYRFKLWKLQRQIDEGTLEGNALRQAEQELERLRKLDYRSEIDEQHAAAEIDRFWEEWQADYGTSGLVNPRGDRLLTELSIRAMRTLRPRLVLINYTDPDYVHWGHMTHYTRGVAIIDQGFKRLVAAVESDPFYRDRTLFVIVPDCGRDSNPFMAVPCQHHFNTKSARELFALFYGPGVERSRIVDKPADQIQVTATIANLMGINAEFAEGDVLSEAIA